MWRFPTTGRRCPRARQSAETANAHPARHDGHRSSRSISAKYLDRWTADTGGANATATVPTWSRPRGDAYRPACDAVAKDRTRSVSVTTAWTHPADGQAWAVVSSGSGTSKPARDSARTTPHAVDGDRGRCRSPTQLRVRHYRSRGSQRSPARPCDHPRSQSRRPALTARCPQSGDIAALLGHALSTGWMSTS